MRKTRRNIARKPKAMKAQRITAKAPPFALGQEPRSESDNCQLATDPCDAAPRTERNRLNAAHSTGPRTAEGKARSSRNACKHGLSIQRHVILQHEDPAEYELLLAELREIYEPQTRREDLAVEDVAQCRWALQRFDEGEVTLLEYHFNHAASLSHHPDNRVTYGEALGYSSIDEQRGQSQHEYPSFLLLQRYRGHWDRRHQRALAEFDRAQRARRAEAAQLRKEAEEERRRAEEQRRQELHTLKLAHAQARLAGARTKARAAQAQEQERAIFQALEKQLETPPPGLNEEQLAALGFVSSSNHQPQTNRRENSTAGFVPSTRTA